MKTALGYRPNSMGIEFWDRNDNKYPSGAKKFLAIATFTREIIFIEKGLPKEVVDEIHSIASGEWHEIFYNEMTDEWARNASIGRIKKGNIIAFNNNFGELMWRILDVRQDEILLLSQNIVGKAPFSEENSSWDESGVKKYLTTIYLDDFPPCKKEQVKDIFLLSVSEVEKYMPTTLERILPNGLPCKWWLRTTKGYHVATVGADGEIDGDKVAAELGVRPATLVDKKAFL